MGRAADLLGGGRKLRALSGTAKRGVRPYCRGLPALRGVAFSPHRPGFTPWAGAIEYRRDFHPTRTPMPAHAMNHFTILTKDVAATQDFYSDILGLTVGYRPPITRPGAWMYAGEQAVLHVIDPIEMPQNPNGVLDHMAFSASGLGDVARSEEHTSELQSLAYLVCRLLLEKKTIQAEGDWTWVGRDPQQRGIRYTRCE